MTDENILPVQEVASKLEISVTNLKAVLVLLERSGEIQRLYIKGKLFLDNETIEKVKKNEVYEKHHQTFLRLKNEAEEMANRRRIAKENYFKERNNLVAVCESLDNLNRTLNGINDTLWGIQKALISQWHDLRENPNDLPEHSYSVIVAYKNSLGNLFIDQGYLGALNTWNVCGLSPYEVIAWCEIPRFEE